MKIYAEIAQLVESNLAKVMVEGSNPFLRFDNQYTGV